MDRGPRTKCINPCCKRTACAIKFPDEMICYACFKSLPIEVRNSHKFYWKEIRKWRKRISKTSDELKLVKMRNILHMWHVRLGDHWDAEIRARVISPSKPMGLEAFLGEIGMA